MGLIITELKHRKPELVYFDDSYQGEYPAEAPFTIGELEEIYPAPAENPKRMRITQRGSGGNSPSAAGKAQAIWLSGIISCRFL